MKLFKINLLRRRHKKDGLDRPLLHSNQTILKKGVITGSIPIVGILMACLFILIQGNSYKKSKDSLKPYADEYDRIISDIKRANLKIDEIINFNKKLATSISEINSSSAILTEISQLIPISLTLDEIKIIDSSINIMGKADHKSALKDINLFILQLEDSPFIQRGTTNLSHAINFNENNSQYENKDSKLSINNLKFSINSKLNPDTSKITSNRLQILGSNGLAHRIKLLNDEQLLNE